MAAATKRVLDIEDAVIWACAEELAKWPHVNRAPDLLQLGELVGREDGLLIGKWRRPASFPEISPMFARGFVPRAPAGRGGDPHPDALIVEAEISAISERLAGLAPPEELVFGIGLAVDVAGAWAAAVANVGNLTLVHGRLRKRPVAGDGRFEVRPKLAPNGKPGVWRIERLTDPLGGERDYENPVQAVRRGLYPPGAFCRVEYEPDPQIVINDRADYCAWRIGLEALAEALSGRLETITALAPAAALFPWTGELDGDRPRDLFAPGAERVFRGAEERELEALRSRGERRPLRRHGAYRRRIPAKPASGTKADRKR